MTSVLLRNWTSLWITVTHITLTKFKIVDLSLPILMSCTYIWSTVCVIVNFSKPYFAHRQFVMVHHYLLSESGHSKLFIHHLHSLYGQFDQEKMSNVAGTLWAHQKVFRPRNCCFGKFNDKYGLTLDYQRKTSTYA